MEAVWALHNPLKSWTLYNLTFRDLRLILLSLTENELKLVKFSKKNSDSWQSIDRQKHADFFSKEGIENTVTAADYPDVVLGGESASDTEYFIIKPNKILHPRLHERHEISVPCVILGTNNQEFHSETVDISEGGLYFKDSIPNWVAGYFLVIVKSDYQLMCSLVEDQKDKKRVQIVSEESDVHFIQYKNWLNSL